jgi:hypothetical protein
MEEQPPLEQRLRDHTSGIIDFPHLEKEGITWQRSPSSKGIIIVQEMEPGHVAYGLYETPRKGSLPELATYWSEDLEKVFSHVDLYYIDKISAHGAQSRDSRIANFMRSTREAVEEQFRQYPGPYDLAFIPRAVTLQYFAAGECAGLPYGGGYKLMAPGKPWQIMVDKRFISELSAYYDAQEASIIQRKKELDAIKSIATRRAI